MVTLILLLIDNSVEAKFDAVKFQKRDVNLVYSKELSDHQDKALGAKLKETKKMV